MQNDQVFQDCPLKKYDGGLYYHTYQDSQKPIFAKKISRKGVTTNYRSAFDQAAFAKLDPFENMTSKYTYY